MRNTLNDNRNRSEKKNLINGSRYGGPAIAMMMLILILGLCIWGSSCDNAATTWATEVASPDGRWLAIANTRQWGGPGMAYVATSVKLKLNKGIHFPVEVLLFSHQYAGMYLKMDWVTPKHLNVTYAPSKRPRDIVSVDFQVVKYQAIDITLQQLASEALETDVGNVQ
jgi:hypothetical protein